MQRRNCTIDQYGNVLMEARLCAGEENLWNGDKKYMRSLLAVFHSLTLCAAVGVSAIRKSLQSAAATLNWTLNFRQLPLLDFALFLFFCLLLCIKSSMLLSHTGINPGLEAQSNFVFWCVEHHIKNLWHLAPTVKICQINDFKLCENCLLFKT